MQNVGDSLACDKPREIRLFASGSNRKSDAASDRLCRPSEDFLQVFDISWFMMTADSAGARPRPH